MPFGDQGEYLSFEVAVGHWWELGFGCHLDSASDFHIHSAFSAEEVGVEVVEHAEVLMAEGFVDEVGGLFVEAGLDELAGDFDEVFGDVVEAGEERRGVFSVVAGLGEEGLGAKAGLKRGEVVGVE